jgi:hypothetical protein|tara:strand:- start:40 stop:567 length:528 start_codon:yes stop_codon:yes gene_type:complete
MSELRTNRIVPRDGLSSGTFGGIIQVVQTVKQGEQTIDGTEADVMSATINLKHASSKVMICWSVCVGRGDDDYGYLKLFEGDSEITGASGTSASSNRINALEGISNRGGGNDDGKLISRLSGTYIHTPSSTTPTIKIRGKMTYGSNVYINRSGDADDNTYEIRPASFLQLFELAG